MKKFLILSLALIVVLIFSLPAQSRQIDIILDKTPGEEVDRHINNINIQYRNISENLPRWEIEESVVSKVPLATKINGYIVVHGAASEPHSGKDWVPEITYSVKEEFVGYLIIYDYYDFKMGSFIDKQDYGLRSYSTNIEVNSVEGRQCLDVDYYTPPNCIKWETFSKEKVDIQEDEKFPHSDCDVISTEPMEPPDEGKMGIKIEVPGIYFRSSDKTGKGVGCARTKILIPKSQFKDFLKKRKVEWEQDFCPNVYGLCDNNCKSGSAIVLYIEICDPERLSKLFNEYYNDKCKQIESLADDFAFAVRARDIYNQLAIEAKVAKAAFFIDLFKDGDALFNSFIEEMSKDYPDSDFEAIKKDQSAYNPETGEITLPDLCKCSVRPLCEWQNKFASIQEEANKMYVESNPDIKKLLTDNQVFHGDAFAEVEAIGYDERARYTLTFINKQTNENPECHFKPEFWATLTNATHDLNK